MSNLFGSTGAGVVIILLIALVVILLLVTVNLNLRMTRLQRRYNLFMKGTDGVSVEKAMAERLRQRALRLRQLKNRYELIPLPLESWPEYARACYELASALPRTFENHW